MEPKSNKPTRRPRLDADRYRKTELAKIHVAKAQMAWTDDTYRAILHRITGKSSAADLTARERAAVLNEFVRLGWNPKKAKSHRAPQRFPLTGAGWGKDRLFAKIGALLAEAGRGWAYADGCARNMFGLESLRFCDPQQLQKIIAALMYDQKRRAKKAPTPPEAK